MPSQRSRRPATGSSPAWSSHSGPPEILRQLGRAVLSYSLRRLGQQDTERSQPDRGSRRASSSRSRTRDAKTEADRGRSGGLSRSHNSDVHKLMTQVAVGVLASGVRHLVQRRREARRRRQTAAQAGTRGVSVGRGQRQSGIDPELSAALDTVARELQGASASIRRLAYSTPSQHRKCPVREALAADADRLEGAMANMQASINNMRNLYEGLGENPRQGIPARSRRRERSREVRTAKAGRDADCRRSRQREVRSGRRP
ncbi:hypothetical protein VTK56DRAFT_6690 [Thermocarpiscus australiensis]